MEDTMKSKIIVILGIVSLLFFALALRSCVDVQKYRKAKDKETAARFDSEDKMNKLKNDKDVAVAKLKEVTQALEEEKAASQATKKALLQEQLVNQSLKEELGKVNKLKEALEENLKQALSDKASAKNKK